MANEAQATACWSEWGLSKTEMWRRSCVLSNEFLDTDSNSEMSEEFPDRAATASVFVLVIQISNSEDETWCSDFPTAMPNSCGCCTSNRRCEVRGETGSGRKVGSNLFAREAAVVTEALAQWQMEVTDYFCQEWDKCWHSERRLFLHSQMYV